MRLIAGNSNKTLVESISAYLGLTPVKADVRRFSDDEIFVEVRENVRGEDMFVIQSTSAPAALAPAHRPALILPTAFSGGGQCYPRRRGQFLMAGATRNHPPLSWKRSIVCARRRWYDPPRSGEREGFSPHAG